jgi:hypothetical protein
LCVVGLALVAFSAAAAPAFAGRGLVVGVNEDAVKWRPGISSTANDLGLGYYRVTQRWEPGRSQANEADAASDSAPRPQKKSPLIKPRA